MRLHIGADAAARKSPIAMLAAALAAVAMLACGAASAHWPPSSLATLEVYDRQDGVTLPVYEKDGRRYVVGTPGHEYTLRIRNLTGQRVLAVTSVDGVNVVTGETAAPDQSGYVLEAFGSVDIPGWRKSLERTAAFYFTDLGDTYAARTGRPGNVGVIGMALFREARPHVSVVPRRDRIAAAQSGAAGSNAMPPASEPQPAVPPVTMRQEAARDGALREEPARDAATDQRMAERSAKTMASPLGTGHGRSEASYATRVTFERASTTPAELVSIQYDRRETLAALGVIPDTRYARRTPQPFPAGGFVADPR
jgi:hypothetical protein